MAMLVRFSQHPSAHSWESLPRALASHSAPVSDFGAQEVFALLYGKQVCAL